MTTSSTEGDVWTGKEQLLIPIGAAAAGLVVGVVVASAICYGMSQRKHKRGGYTSLRNRDDSMAVWDR
jgi:hypothetical protein